MCNVNLLLQMSYSLKIEEISMKITEVEACMTVSQRNDQQTHSHVSTQDDGGCQHHNRCCRVCGAFSKLSGSRRTLHATHHC